MLIYKLKHNGKQPIPKSNILTQNIGYMKYLFAKPFSIRSLFCRMNGHKCGVVWYNVGGDEPDMHCKNCGDDLG
jgi:hypothetical protein